MEIRYIVSMAAKDFTFTAYEKNEAGEFVFYDTEKQEATNLINAGYALPKEAPKKATKAK